MRYDDWEQHSHNFASYLQNVQGLERGDRIALMMPNLLQYPVAMFGALRAGLVVVSIDSDCSAAELEYQLKDAGVAAIVVFENSVPTLQRMLECNLDLDLSIVTTNADDMSPRPKGPRARGMGKKATQDAFSWQIAESEPFDAALRGGEGFELRESSPNLADLAFLQYTSGTSGVRKGVMLTHGNLVAVIAQLGAWTGNCLRQDQEVFVCPLPLHRIDVLTICLALADVGAHTLLVAEPENMRAFTQQLRSYPVTVMVGESTLYSALLEAKEFTDCEMPALKVAFAVGMAVEHAVAQRWKKVTGIQLTKSYGLTECSSVAVCNRVDSLEWTGSVGLPLPSTEIAIVDLNGREVPCGTVGEICIRGPQVMNGYWRRDRETAQILTIHHWLHTGDEGVMDQWGYVSLIGRTKGIPAASALENLPGPVEGNIAPLVDVKETPTSGLSGG